MVRMVSIGVSSVRSGFLYLVSDEFIHFADDFEDVHAMALSSLPEIFIIGNEAAYAGHAVFHEEGSHFRIYFNDLHDVVFRTDEIAGRQRRNFRGIPAAVAVEAVGGFVSRQRLHCRGRCHGMFHSRWNQ